jgi:hypothetical protein
MRNEYVRSLGLRWDCLILKMTGPVIVRNKFTNGGEEERV